MGACMQCNKQNCKNQFHVTCAQQQGLLCEEAGNYSDNVKYCGYCQDHYTKLVSDWSTSVMRIRFHLQHFSGSFDCCRRKALTWKSYLLTSLYRKPTATLVRKNYRKSTTVSQATRELHLVKIPSFIFLDREERKLNREIPCGFFFFFFNM